MSIPVAPENVLSRKVGNGSCEIAWTAVAGAVSYNVYMATALAGTYSKANRAPVTENKTTLPNIVFGTTVYFKVTAINADGESAQSAVSEDAVADKAVTTLRFESLVGDVIPAGKVFTAFVGAKLISLQTTGGGVCA